MSALQLFNLILIEVHNFQMLERQSMTQLSITFEVRVNSMRL